MYIQCVPKSSTDLACIKISLKDNTNQVHHKFTYLTLTNIYRLLVLRHYCHYFVITFEIIKISRLNLVLLGFLGQGSNIGTICM